MAWHEVNFDGLVGATHNYAGLSCGNIASKKNQGRVSNPRQGALQGLSKMKSLRAFGLVQGILPPHDRPHLSTLRELGFSGSDAEILTKAYASNPALVANLSSSSTMWTANAATVTPSPDAKDGRTHFTPANLAAMYHRSIEAKTTGRILRAMFPAGERFVHHEPIPGGVHIGDEGAANHNRFCADYGEEGVSLFVYGRSAFEEASKLQFPGRQSKESCDAIFSSHGVLSKRSLVARQNPAAINAGAFHNDVVAVSNKNVFFYHQEAFSDAASLCDQIQSAMGKTEMRFIEVPSTKVSLDDAVSTYLFNSQLISPDSSSGMSLILPSQVQENEATRNYVSELLDGDSPIEHAEYFDLRESMQNGGGPACLRLRVAMSDADLSAMSSRSILDDGLMLELQNWVAQHYRDRVRPEDLGDVALMEENFCALDELTTILELGPVYDFQT